MRSYVVMVAFSALALVAAQTQNFTINVPGIDPQKKAVWCQGQENSCDLLCPGSPLSNDCDDETLVFACLCRNGTAPGLEYYSNTMPTFICDQAYDECIQANIGKKLEQDACKTDIQDKCGRLDAASADVQTTTTTAAPTTSATGGSNPTESAAIITTSSSSAFAAPTGPAHYGNGAAAVAVGLLAYLV